MSVKECCKNHPKEKHKSTQTGKKKGGCFKRCKRRIFKWCCKKILSCIKKKVFGIPDTPLEDIKSALNVGSKKSKIKLNKAQKRMIEDLSATDLNKKHSVKGSKARLLEDMVTDFKKGDASALQLFTKNKPDFKKMNRKELNKLLDDYEKVKNNKNALDDINIGDLKNKFSLTGTKGEIFDQIMDDYKKGKTSKIRLSGIGIIDPKKINKNQVNDLINTYETNNEKLSFLEKSKIKVESIMDQLKAHGVSKTFLKPYK